MITCFACFALVYFTSVFTYPSKLRFSSSQRMSSHQIMCLERFEKILRKLELCWNINRESITLGGPVLRNQALSGCDYLRESQAFSVNSAKEVTFTFGAGKAKSDTDNAISWKVVRACMQTQLVSFQRGFLLHWRRGSSSIGGRTSLLFRESVESACRLK